MRLAIKPGDRLHMTVWRTCNGTGWCVAVALNGIPVGSCDKYPTWREAMDAALWEVQGVS